MPPVVNPKLCDGCTICVRSCPGDIIYFDKSTKLPIIKYPDECWHCGLCRIDCQKHLKTASAIDYFFPESWIQTRTDYGTVNEIIPSKRK
ncbi:MAG: ferredoxin family protein [Nitrososphaerota archaeon]|nr:ferredoxin family protein [Nitrososphaerota archaeon]